VLKDRYIKLELKRILKTIAKWKGFHIHAWHIGDEHIHLFVSIPPKHSVAYAMAIMKGKTSVWIKKKTNKFPQGTLWARGYFISTIGANEFQIRAYVNNQSHHQVELAQQRFSWFKK
jgi:putative transposase